MRVREIPLCTGMMEKKDKHRLLLRLWRIAMRGNHPPLPKSGASGG